jgi:DNA-binding NtrC family response regulator
MCDYDLVLMDVRMPKLSGMDVLPRMVVDHPDTSVVMLTAIAATQTAVEAMKLGAYDYVTKPFNMDDVLLRVEKALERRRLLLENREYQRRLEQRVQRQAGEIRRSNHEAEAALTREQAALAELEALRQCRSGFVRKVADIVARSSDGSYDGPAGDPPGTA